MNVAPMPPGEITPNNDLTIPLGPIRGRDPADNTWQNFEGTQVTARLKKLPEGTAPTLGASKNFSVIPEAMFLVHFDAVEVNAALAAAAPLVAEAPLYCVVEAVGEFQLAVPLVYRTARIA